MVSNAMTLKTVLAIEGDMNKKSSLKARMLRPGYKFKQLTNKK